MKKVQGRIIQREVDVQHRRVSGGNVLAEELASMARQGYAIDNEENERGVRCAGRRLAGTVRSIEHQRPGFAMPLATADALGPVVIAAAAELSARLGASVHPDELQQKLL